jgi:hypothetical protein
MQSGRHRTLVRETDTRTVAAALRAHPEWSFEALLTLAARDSQWSAALRSLTVGELLAGTHDVRFALPNDAGPMIDLDGLERARHRTGKDYDDLVHAVLVEAGRAVGSRYLVARVGGPRWKLLASVWRLVESGHATRTGVTSATRYCCVVRRSS